MKRYFIALVLACLAVPAMAGYTVSLVNSSNGDGGYYDATMIKDGGTPETFKTFCLENNEVFIPEKSYNATIDTTIMNSGTDKDVSTGTDYSLNEVSKKLYAAYLDGKLDSIANIDNSTSGSTYSVLQQTFWAIESKTVPSSIINMNQSSSFVYTYSNDLVTISRTKTTLISAVLNSTYANIADGLDYDNVVVVNLWTATGAPQQSQLYMLPESPTPNVPAPASVILSGLGTGLVAMIRRRSL
ncbi:MAG: hypothetical protein JXM68_12655 [Sedimentisphaerales bacterium]|nr:hypothetical protein [Sedimentisphaerales bacterium]